MSAALQALLFVLSTSTTCASCCVGTTGNVDGSADGVADISDVFAMVDYLGTSVPLSSCVDENDVNKDGTIDISDLFALIDYLSGAAPLPACPGTVIDVDGNSYRTVVIGTQVWMAENLKVTHYRNGDAIPNITDAGTWAGMITGAYCEYNNDASNVDTYGRLYNWFAASDGRNIAPAGWHVPSDVEWKQLETYLGMSQTEADADGYYRGTVEGGKLKESGTAHWYSPNSGATNESGFSALPGGYGGPFVYMGLGAGFWSSTENISSTGWDRGLWGSLTGIGRYDSAKQSGFSIRCVKD